MADNNTILDKLEGLVSRFEEVSTPYYRPGSDCRHEALREIDQGI